MSKITEVMKGASSILMAIVVAIMFLLFSPSGFAAETENISYRCSCGKVFSSEAKWLKHKEKCDAIVVEETVPTTASTTAEPSTEAPTTAPTTVATTVTTTKVAVPISETTAESTTEMTFIVPVIDLSPYEEEVVAENATTTAPTTVVTTAVSPTTTTTKATTIVVTKESPSSTTTESTTVSENTTGVATSDAFYADAEPTTPNEEDVLFPNTGSISRGVIAAIAVAASSICVIVTLKKKDT